MDPRVGSIQLQPARNWIYSCDLFILVSGKRPGASFIINLAWLVGRVQHSSGVLFEHLASNFTGGCRELWQVTESRRDPVGWALWEKVDVSLSLDSLAVLLSSRGWLLWARPGEGEEVNPIGEISGHCQLWGGRSPPPLPLTHPFKTRTILLPQPQVS